MPRRGNDLYGDYGSVPNVEPRGTGNAQVRVRATPDSFGGQIGEALNKAGKQTFDMALQFQEIATESKVNDDYANHYIPAFSKLRNNYDMLRGQDKVAGYDSYISGIQQLNKEFISKQPSQYGQRLMTGMVDKHYTSEMLNAQEQLVKSQKLFSDQATADAIIANNLGVAVPNYNNASVVDSVLHQNDNLILKQYIDNGHDPNNPDSQILIHDAQSNVRGDLAWEMVQKAVNAGDAESANDIRARFSPYIPGYKQLSMDNVLHAENIKQTSKITVDDLMLGKPIPQAIGAPPAEVQALVANTAKSNGANPNTALTILRIESANGQNLGTRGTLGQDKESAGKPLNIQAKTLVDNLNLADDRATAILGRPAEPWEAYVVYQQGHGGGAALLKEALENPNKPAIEVLRNFYDNSRIALSAIKGNGGNITMSASDFVNHIKQLYDDNARRANSQLEDTDSPGDAIIQAHAGVGIAVQPATSPVGYFHNIESKTPEILARINAIPNYEVRQGVMEAFNERYSDAQRAARSYADVTINKAKQLAVDPNFTSIEQLPAQLYAEVLEASPETIRVLKKYAKENRERETNIPLDFTNPNTLPSQIASRITSAKVTSELTGEPVKVLSDQDRAKLADMWNAQTTNQKIILLNDLYKNLNDSGDYMRAVQQIRPDSPVTALAGSFVGLNNKITIQERGIFSDELTVSPDVVAQRLLEGEELLNPSSMNNKTNGKGKVFPMPPDETANGLRSQFTDYVGDAFRSAPAIYNQAYQAYRAYYAAESARNGVYSTELDSDIAEQAVKAVVGTVVEKNGSKVIAPWGMNESTFNDLAKINFDNALESNGYQSEIFDWDDVKLQNRLGSVGSYYIVIGSGYLLDKEGNPLTINITPENG